MKGDRSYPSTYRPIVLNSCLYKSYDAKVIRKFLKHPSSFNLLSDDQYRFRKGRSTGDLTFPTDSWSPFVNHLGESFAVA